MMGVVMTGCKCKRIYASLILLLPVVAMLCSGCWDRQEINDVAFVLASAIDKEAEGLYRVTLQIALPGQMGGAEGGGGKGTSGSKKYYVDSDVGHTLSEVVYKMQSRMSRRLYFSHRRVIVVGEETAKEGVRSLFDLITRNPQNRLSIYMLVAEGKGYDLLNAKPDLEGFSGEAMRELAKSDTVLHMNMKSVAQLMSKNGSDPVMLYMGVRNAEKGTEQSKEIQILGYAQFSNDKMVNMIPLDHASGLNSLLNQSTNNIITIPAGGDHVSLMLIQRSARIHPAITGDRAKFDIRIRTSAKVVENTSLIDLSKPANVGKLKTGINALIKNEIRDTISGMKQHAADSAGFGLYLSRAEPRKWKEDYQWRWHEALKEADFNIELATEITDIGLTTGNIAEKERFH